MRAFNDGKALGLFNSIAAEPAGAPMLMKKLRITRKQFYSRESKLKMAGLIRRYQNEYMLTSLGRIVLHTHNVIGQAASEEWRYRLIDDMKFIPKNKRKEIEDSIINNQEVRDMLRGKAVSDRYLRN